MIKIYREIAQVRGRGHFKIFAICSVTALWHMEIILPYSLIHSFMVFSIDLPVFFFFFFFFCVCVFLDIHLFSSSNVL